MDIAQLPQGLRQVPVEPRQAKSLAAAAECGDGLDDPLPRSPRVGTQQAFPLDCGEVGGEARSLIRVRKSLEPEPGFGEISRYRLRPSQADSGTGATEQGFGRARRVAPSASSGDHLILEKERCIRPTGREERFGGIEQCIVDLHPGPGLIPHSQRALTMPPCLQALALKPETFRQQRVQGDGVLLLADSLVDAERLRMSARAPPKSASFRCASPPSRRILACSAG